MKKTIVSKTKNINFYQLINELFKKIEDYININDYNVDTDYEIQDYVLTITFPNNKVIIINKQESFHQVWMATTVNGYHFNYKNNQWICNRSKKNFWEIFKNEYCLQLKQNCK